MKGWKKEYFNLLFYNEENPFCSAKLNSLKENNLPKKLYRYRSINQYTTESLRTDTAYLGPAICFNDPYDSGLTINSDSIQENLIKKILIEVTKDGMLKQNETTKSKMLGLVAELESNKMKDILSKSDFQNTISVVDSMTNGYISKLSVGYQENIYIACFSEINDNILMWSHYAQYHEGICIEYDFDKLDYIEKKRILFGLFPVKYSKAVFSISDYKLQESLSTAILAAISKFNCWKYEKEWRIISFLKEEQQFKLNKPTAVILGTKISEENKALITAICVERDIPIKQAVLDRTQYKLHIK